MSGDPRPKPGAVDGGNGPDDGAEAEGPGRAEQAEAFRRLGLMREVGECLAGESPGAAAGVAAFCEEAFARLGREEGGAGGGGSEAARWVLRESEARWGDYLRLIDPSTGPAFEADGPPDPADDAPAAIDPGTLFRMLTGDTSASRHAGEDWTSPSPPPSPSPSPSPSPVAVTEPARRAAPPPPSEPACDLDLPPVPANLAIDPDLRDTFLAEAADLFDRIEALVLGLGRGGRHAETLNELGRCFHTLKGAAGSVGLASLAAVIHAAEERLEVGSGEAGSGLVDLLHKLLHYLEGVFIAVRRGGASGPDEAPPPPPAPARVAAPSVAYAAPPPAPPPPPAATAHPVPVERRRPPADAADGAAGEGPVRVSAERVDELMDLASELISRRGLWASQAETMKEFAAMARTCRVRMAATIDRIRDLSHVEVRPGARHDGASAIPELLGRLEEQSEDLAVLTESARAASKPLADNSEALARLTLQLWESLQAVRIVPVKGLFQRLARVSHDAARVEGRQVDVSTVGEETGVDRALQDKAFEPLLHVVRNAVCHGIEAPAERLRSGKPAAGKVTLEAVRSGNTLTLTVQDDGRGLDYDAIASKGRRLNLIGPAETPGVDRLNALIFQPGFSTREAANAIAGRGVGMDVVSQEVGRLHGTVSLSSLPGQGTRLSLCLPARLSLQQAMVLRLDGQAFALPVELIELAQPFEPEGVVRDGPSPRVRVRDVLAPVLAAREAMGMPPAGALSCPKLLLIRADGEPLAVVVDSIDGTRELVFKPLNDLIAGHPLVSGVALSVSGEAILALNPSGLARWLREGHARGASREEPAGPPRKTPVLVVDDSISVRRVVARQLRSLGFEVEEVSDGLEALGRLRTSAYGLVVTDLEMPRMDGFELLAELRRLGVARTTPVIATSTKADPETRRRVTELGARDFVPKPIAAEELTAKVRALVGPVAVHVPIPVSVPIHVPVPAPGAAAGIDRSRP